MNKYNYDEITNELITNHVITGKDVYYYSSYPTPHIFNQLFQFCQKNLSEFCIKMGYNIEPARIYFTNNYSVNALAARGETYYVIKINMGAIHSLFDLFCNNDILDAPELIDYKKFGKALEENLKKDQRVSLSYLMYQNAVTFTYYHELGHLIQFSNKGRIKTMATERYVNNANDKFDQLKHIEEYDADIHGSASMAFHIMNLWSKLPSVYKSEEVLKKLVITSLVSITSYIFFLWSSIKENIYYDKYGHPHPLIRITWICSNLIETVKANFSSFKTDEIMDETLRILDIYFKHKSDLNIQTQFIEPLVYERSNIRDYCYSVIGLSRTVPYLVINTIHKKLEE